MQFTNEVIWDNYDFIIAAILLLGTGLAINTILSRVQNIKHKISITLIIILLLLLIWVELAVRFF